MVLIMFNRIDQRKSYLKSGAKPLISESDVTEILQNSYLHDLKSHFIVSKDGSYDDRDMFVFGIAPDRIKLLSTAYNQGLTILVKDLENWNQDIQAKCRAFGFSTNTHMYLSPAKGTGFAWHTDDRDVYVFLQKGEKHFEIEEWDGEISSYTLTAGSELFIPYGAKHRAKSEAASIHLSFGVWPEGCSIQRLYESFNFPLNIGL